MIGNQCPVKANVAMYYSSDYSFTEDVVCKFQKVQKSILLTVEDLQAENKEENSSGSHRHNSIWFNAEEIEVNKIHVIFAVCY